MRKLPIYARAGLAHAWLVDPAARTLEVLRLHESRWLVADAFRRRRARARRAARRLELNLAPLWLPPG
ncbi:MAG TPA: Uma2 family endonuclease [Myxococcota bacterium]|nr:Uma2 family endonuclease [Myxococcota bacterium]